MAAAAARTAVRRRAGCLRCCLAHPRSRDAAAHRRQLEHIRRPWPDGLTPRRPDRHRAQASRSPRAPQHRDARGRRPGRGAHRRDRRRHDRHCRHDRRVAKRLREEGAKRIVACATHPLFSDSATGRLRDSEIEQIVVTNTLPVPPEHRLDNLVVLLSIAPIIASALRAVFDDESVSEIFRGRESVGVATSALNGAVRSQDHKKLLLIDESLLLERTDVLDDSPQGSRWCRLRLGRAPDAHHVGFHSREDARGRSGCLRVGFWCRS